MTLFQMPKSLQPKGDSAASSSMFNDTSKEVSEENLRERRYLWTARAFAIVAVISFVTNIIMLMALYSLVPLVRVQPYELIFSDKETQTVSVQPLHADQTVLNGITESMIRQYVSAVHTITDDPDEMAYRWGANGIVRLWSTDNVFLKFSNDAGKALEEAVKEQKTQTIEINYVSRYVGGQYWLVSFNIITMTPQSATKQIDPYIATINITYEPYKGTWENRLKNPIGFKVIHYGVETQAEFEGRERELLKDKKR